MKFAAAFALCALALSAALQAHEGDLPGTQDSRPEREVPPKELEPGQPAEPMAERGQSLPMEPARHIDIDVREGSWLSLDIAPDGGSIVFDLLGDLYRLPISGGKAERLTGGMAFDSQPVFSPDGRRIAFISDRSGAENIWIAQADGSRVRQVTRYDGNTVFTSPEWSRDGTAIFVSRYRVDRAAFELWRFDAATGGGTLIAPIKHDPAPPRDRWQSTLGAVPSPDGRSLYFARHVGSEDSGHVPEWTIVRRDLASGEERTIVSAPRSPRPDLVLGTAFRPMIAPDGRSIVYGARDRGQTGLKLLDLASGDSRWLVFPAQADQLQAAAWRDFLPRHDFTPDGRALIANIDNRLVRVDLADGTRSDIPFHVTAEIGIGPSTRQTIRAETGPVRARLIQHPVPSPDGARLAFSTLGSIYVMPLAEDGEPERVTGGFQPGWSPDGGALVFVRWTARDAGSLWLRDLATGRERQISTIPAFYTAPTFTPDGRRLLSIRSSNDVRMHSYMEYGATRAAELVALPVAGGQATVLASGGIGGTPHFGPDGSQVYVNFSDGVSAVPLAGGKPDKFVEVTGPGWYFAEGRAQADDIRISPDGREALVQIAQQLHLIALPEKGAKVDLADPDLPRRRLTDVGADYFAWASDGATIGWAVGSTWFEQPRAALSLTTGSGAEQVQDAARRFEAPVLLPRASVASGRLLLRGGTAITMEGERVIADADILVEDGRIAATGPRGSFTVPADTTVCDVSGKWVVPGFIETHVHVADVRRQILDFESWGPLANLAYGVTTAFDPSTLTIDMLAYQDAIEAGLMVGSRIPSTGTAIFSFNEFDSYAEVKAVVSRYRDHYRLGNIKLYRTGNRRVRQWVARAARELGVQPTTEGALAMKLGLTQMIDGLAGHEHALTVAPLGEDVLTLMAESGVGYTTTLMIGNGGPEGQDYFITRDQPAEDPKLNRFAPRFVVDMKMRKRTWRPLEDYFFPEIAASAAKLVRQGGLVGIGSHGEIPGLGFHWEMEAHVLGGMTPAEALRAGTIGSAKVIGHDADYGSLAVGKVADLVILDRDPLADIRNTRAIAAVMQAGRLREGETLDEIWPEQKPLPRRWYCDDRPPGTPDPCASIVTEETVP